MHAYRLVCDCKDYEVTAGSQLFQHAVECIVAAHN